MAGPKRVTERQLAANRRNAQRSTGPRTAEGQAVSRWNALKHGALSQALIPPALEPYESREEFEALLGTLRSELDPGSALEEMLVERIATSYWRLARLLRAEAGEISELLDRSEADFRRPNPFADNAAFGLSAGDASDLERRINAMVNAGRNVRNLRSILSEQDPRWRDAPEDELLQATDDLLADLREQKAVREAQQLSIMRATRSIPMIERAVLMARYETTLERQIYSALAALERIQRMRGGDSVPAPLEIKLDM